MPVALEEAVKISVPRPVAVCKAEGVAVALALTHWEGEAVKLVVALAVLLARVLGVAITVGDALLNTLSDRVSALALELELGLPPQLLEALLVAHGLGEPKLEALTVSVPDTVLVPVPEVEGVSVLVPEGLALCDAVAEPLVVPVG